MESVPWFAPELGEAEIEKIIQVINSGYINDGEVTREFENVIADFLGVKYCVAVTSGTVAISLALKALGIGPGDEVLVPDFTFIASANAVKMIGAEVKLVDIETEKFTICPNSLEAKIGPNTRAILSVDINGRGANYPALEQIAKKHNLLLVSDSAEALGSKYDNQYIGTFGNAGCFSLSANKTLSTGQGGLIVTNDACVYSNLRQLKDQGRRQTGTGGDDEHPVIGFNFKFTNIQAAIGLAQFNKLKQRLQHFIDRDRWYKQHLAGFKELLFPKMSVETGEICQWTDCLSSIRDEIVDICQASGFGVRKFWHPLHTQTPYFEPGLTFPNSSKVSKEGFWLPSSFSLTEPQVVQLQELLNEKVHAKSCFS